MSRREETRMTPAPRITTRGEAMTVERLAFVRSYGLHDGGPNSSMLVVECANEIERLRRWIDDLQSSLFVNCVYCGHRYGPGDTTPATMADALKAHVAQCPAHPMSRVVDVLEACSHALKSYAFGNASPDLAASVAETADAAIAAARSPAG